MSGILVIAEHLQGEIREVTRELVTAGKQLGGPVAVAVIASDPAALRSSVNVEGVDEIVEVPAPVAEFENDIYQAAVEALIAEREPDAVLLPFTVNGMGYGAAVATKLGLGFASDVFGVGHERGHLVAQRAMYGGKVHAELELPVPAVLMLRPTIWKAPEGVGQASVAEFNVELGSSRARHQEFVEPPSSGIDITTANLLLSIGRGIGEQENVPYFEGLAEKMGATLSASRPLIDSGWLPSDRQVGQSGKTVKPALYLSFGISGAVQHQAGIKSAGAVIAVNNDPESAIFTVADYGAVADLFEVAQELEKLY